MSFRLNKATLPASFKFALASQNRTCAFTLTRPQISVARPHLTATSLQPTGNLHRSTMARPQLARQEFMFHDQRAAFKMLLPAWTEKELHTLLMVRLRRRPATLLDLSRALFMPGWNAHQTLARTLACLEQERRVAICSPEHYFALPWERLAQAYTPPSFSLGGYTSLAASFWRHQGVVPSTEQEPNESVRDVVARHFEWQWRKAEQPTQTGQRSITYLSTYVTNRPESGETEIARQAALAQQSHIVALQAAHPWLLTPPGTHYVTILGTRFRIDLSQLPSGRLWTYRQSTGQQISGVIKDGGLFVTAGKGQGWTAIQNQADITRHFQDARLASRQGELTAYPTGEKILQALLAR